MEDSDRCQPVSCFDYGWSARRSRVEGASPYATTVAFLAAFFGRRPNCRLTARQERRREGGVPWSCGGADLPTRAADLPTTRRTVRQPPAEGSGENAARRQARE